MLVCHLLQYEVEHALLSAACSVVHRLRHLIADALLLNRGTVVHLPNMKWIPSQSKAQNICNLGGYTLHSYLK